MNILGINAFHGDASVALIRNGNIEFALEEEKLNRIKHSAGFPIKSLKYCLDYKNLELNNIDLICFNFNPRANFFSKLKYSILNINQNRRLIHKIKNQFMKINSINYIKNKYFPNFKNDFKFFDHHMCHLASSYFISPFDNSTVVSIDGFGDFSSSYVGIANYNKIKIIQKSFFPHSPGLFYLGITQYLNFNNYGDEYKVMGLASYGKPIYKERIKKLIKTGKNFFQLDLSYFDFKNTIIDYDFESGVPFFDDLYSSKIEKLFGRPRSVNQPISQIHKDIASSLQFVLEEIILNKLKELKKKYKVKNLCLSGGCAFNSTLNGKIIKSLDFDRVYMSPNPGDAGGAPGAALFYAEQKKIPIITECNPYLGTSYNNEYIEKNIIPQIQNFDHIKAIKYEDFKDLNIATVKILKGPNVVGWFQGKMEWGPRALGNRSIIANPSYKLMREIINIKIKKREEFRPFAPAILHEKVEEYFLVKDDTAAGFMGAIYDVKDSVKDKIPAVIHVDNTARVQTVSKQSNLRFYNLIKEFNNQTNIPVLLNTSLNVNEPICESPENAFEVFTKTSMDALIIENWLFLKND